MNMWRQKHRMTYWLRKLFVVFSLVASWNVQAVLLLDTSPSVLTWCTSIYSMADHFVCNFPTDFAAAQEAITLYNEWNVQLHIADPTVLVVDYTLLSCDGTGHCATCATFTQINQPTGHVCGVILPWAGLMSVCPVPKSHPEIPYIYYSYGNDCYRYIPDNPVLTVTFIGSNEVQPPNILPFSVVVKDQNGVVQPGTQVALTVDVQTLDVQSGANGVLNGEGGHLHTANRPKGGFACSAQYAPGSALPTCTLTMDGNGEAPFIFISTAVSGAHTITATCNNCTTATALVNVKIDNLITIPASSKYALSDSNGVIGAVPGKHTDNHYLASGAITELKDLANIYTAINPGAILYLNDASLVWGGLFDVDVVNSPWSRPHAGHQKGTSIDIRAANSGPNNQGSVPSTLFSRFIEEATKKGFRIGLHCKNSSDTNYCLSQPNNRHFHVDF
ncbi:hypothetical protein GALL_33310 [mine drainage metagenome]|uniref:Uncharacterized protein n=1 Tax=mine drainage metagenome TaxID=410659 RepID=A0A1J5TUQ8_9ZZZZ